MRSSPEELYEQVMVPWHERQLSRRDKARLNYVRKFRAEQQLKSSIREMIREQREFMQEVEDGTALLKQMNYNELVEEVNKDLKQIEEMNNPLVIKKEQD